MVGKKKFIVIDGLDGLGKTTIIKIFKRIYKDEVVFTREPGGTGSVVAEKLRHIMLKYKKSGNFGANMMFGLIWPSREANMNDVVIPALKSGKHVISDRGDSSTVAYQIFGPQAKYLLPLFWLTRKIFLGKFTPDLYIILDADPRIGLKRKAEQKGITKNHFDNQTLSFHRRVRKGFKYFSKSLGVDCVIVDANRPQQVVLNEVLEIVQKTLETRNW